MFWNLVTCYEKCYGLIEKQWIPMKRKQQKKPAVADFLTLDLNQLNQQIGHTGYNPLTT